MDSARTLEDLALGETAVVTGIAADTDLATRLMQMGVCPGEKITLHHRAPLGGPLQIELMDYRLAIRREDARKITIQ